ncbi:MAG TPA: hypothetical protein PLW65_05200 [Pseudomonadota bacterium]|nr:hypothetical protein [Pseudomonadota bacterium]
MIVQLDDARVAQARDDPGFIAEADDDRLPRGDLQPQQLDGAGLLAKQIPGAVDGAHRAAADSLINAVSIPQGPAEVWVFGR